MPELPTAEQLAAVERRWSNVREVAAELAGDPNVETDWNVAVASADDVPQLLAWIRSMLPGYALLGHARRALDKAADRENGCTPEARVAAADMAQRITDEIGHPATDEPALGPDLREENQRLAAKVERLKSGAVAALERGDKLAAALDRARGELATAQAAASCTCQDQDAGPEPSPESYDVVIGALVAAAPCASVDRMAKQIAAWVLPCRRAGLAAQLAMALFNARRGRDSLSEQLADVQRAYADAQREMADEGGARDADAR
jgi:hypothetical protein